MDIEELIDAIEEGDEETYLLMSEIELDAETIKKMNFAIIIRMCIELADKELNLLIERVEKMEQAGKDMSFIQSIYPEYYNTLLKRDNLHDCIYDLEKAIRKGHF